MRVAFALLVAACNAAGGVPFEQYGAAAEDAECAWIVRCRYLPDDATCRAVLDPKAFDLRTARASIAAGRMSYDTAAAASCLAATRAALCPAAPFADPSCARVFVGLRGAGASCTTGLDCGTGLTCAEPSCVAGCCTGTCVAGSPPAMSTPLPLGAPCVTHTDCAVDAYCDATFHCAQMPSQAGQPCLFGCTWGDLRCDPDTLRCVQEAGLGAACGAGAPCNPNSAYCDGVCMARPVAGGACDDTRRCVGGTKCVGGVCSARGTAGASCATNDDCAYVCDKVAETCVDSCG